MSTPSGSLASMMRSGRHSPSFFPSARSACRWGGSRRCLEGRAVGRWSNVRRGGTDGAELQRRGSCEGGGLHGGGLSGLSGLGGSGVIRSRQHSETERASGMSLQCVCGLSVPPPRACSHPSPPPSLRAGRPTDALSRRGAACGDERRRHDCGLVCLHTGIHARGLHAHLQQGALGGAEAFPELKGPPPDP